MSKITIPNNPITNAPNAPLAENLLQRVADMIRTKVRTLTPTKARAALESDDFRAVARQVLDRSVEKGFQRLDREAVAALSPADLMTYSMTKGEVVGMVMEAELKKIVEPELVG